MTENDKSPKITCKDLMRVLKINEESAQSIIRLMESSVFTVDEVLDAANDYANLYGVEALRDERAWVDSYYMDIIALYLNTGDTYDETLIFDTETRDYLLTSWGDFYEAWENEKCDGENMDDYYERINSD